MLTTTTEPPSTPGMALLPRVSHLRHLVGASCPKLALRAGAAIYLNFISLSQNLSRHGDKTNTPENTPLCLNAAARRYLRFKGFGGTLVPTRDISFIWAADMLRPSLYTCDAEYAVESSWYFHQQCRLLQSGVNIEAITEPSRVAGAISYGAVFGGVAGMVVRTVQKLTPAIHNVPFTMWI